MWPFHHNMWSSNYLNLISFCDMLMEGSELAETLLSKSWKFESYFLHMFVVKI